MQCMTPYNILPSPPLPTPPHPSPIPSPVPFPLLSLSIQHGLPFNSEMCTRLVTISCQEAQEHQITDLAGEQNPNNGIGFKETLDIEALLAGTILAGGKFYGGNIWRPEQLLQLPEEVLPDILDSLVPDTPIKQDVFQYGYVPHLTPVHTTAP